MIELLNQHADTPFDVTYAFMCEAVEGFGAFGFNHAFHAIEGIAPGKSCKLLEVRLPLTLSPVTLLPPFPVCYQKCPNPPPPCLPPPHPPPARAHAPHAQYSLWWNTLLLAAAEQAYS